MARVKSFPELTKARRRSRTLKFDPESHTYRVGRKIIPSVTQLLGEAGFDGWLRYARDSDLEFARKRGSYIHELTALLDRGELDLEAVKRQYPEAIGYLKGWAKFRLGWPGLHPVLIEETLRLGDGSYAGKPDRVFRGANVDFPTVLDVKTGQMPASVWLQTMGYGRGIFTGQYFAQMSVLLRADGSFVARTREISKWEEDRDAWAAVCRLNSWRCANGPRPRWKDHDGE